MPTSSAALRETFAKAFSLVLRRPTPGGQKGRAATRASGLTTRPQPARNGADAVQSSLSAA
jgi:hypothetical protein